MYYTITNCEKQFPTLEKAMEYAEEKVLFDVRNFMLLVEPDEELYIYECDDDNTIGYEAAKAIIIYPEDETKPPILQCWEISTY